MLSRTAVYQELWLEMLVSNVKVVAGKWQLAYYVTYMQAYQISVLCTQHSCFW